MSTIQELRVNLAEKEVELLQKEREVIQLKIQIAEAESAEETTEPEVECFRNNHWADNLHGRGYGPSDGIDTDEKAVQFAKEHKYQTITKRPSGYTYYFRDPITYDNCRTHEEILSGKVNCPGATTWVLKY